METLKFLYHESHNQVKAAYCTVLMFLSAGSICMELQWSIQHAGIAALYGRGCNDKVWSSNLDEALPVVRPLDNGTCTSQHEHAWPHQARFLRGGPLSIIIWVD